MFSKLLVQGQSAIANIESPDSTQRTNARRFFKNHIVIGRQYRTGDLDVPLMQVKSELVDSFVKVLDGHAHRI